MTTSDGIIHFLEFDPNLWVSFALLFLLFLLSAMFSGAETSLFSLTPIDIQKIQRENSRTDRAILSLLSRRDRLRATLLIADVLINICIAVFADRIMDRVFLFHSHGWEFTIKTVIIAFLLLLFGEAIPKIFAGYSSCRFAKATALPLLFARTILGPLSFLLVKLSGAIREKGGHKGGNISMDELSDALEMTSSQSKEEKKMLTGIISFVNTEVEEIMHPRLDITAIDIETGYDEVKRTIVDSGFSRIPVYRESIDNIEGVLYVKDLLASINEGDNFEWQKYLRKVYYVPEHKKINDLLEEFQANKVHMAIVVDEYGSTLGLVSLEDILEEIVGEISDESDVEEKFYTKTDEKSYVFEGKTRLCDFERVIGVAEDTFDDVKGEAESIAGLILEIKRDFPKRGDSVVIHNIRFTVVSIEGHRIDKIKTELLP